MQFGGIYPWEFNEATVDGVRLTNRGTLALELTDLYYEYAKVVVTSVSATSSYSASYNPSNVIDDSSISGSSWNSWYSAAKPTPLKPQALIFDFGKNTVVDAFRWFFMDNQDNRQPLTYSLFHSVDGHNWDPVVNLSNGVYDPKSQTIVEQALKADTTAADINGNTISGNTNNALNRVEPQWICHTFAPINARYFKMLISDYGGGGVSKFGRRHGEVVGVTEVQFYNLSETIEGISTYVSRGTFESKVLVLPRVETVLYKAHSPASTSVEVYYRKAPSTSSILDEEWLPLPSEAETLSYDITELETTEWLFQFKLILTTENPLITPEVSFLQLVYKPEQVVTAYTVISPTLVNGLHHFSKGSTLTAPQTFDRHQILQTLSYRLYSTLGAIYMNRGSLDQRVEYKASDRRVDVLYETKGVSEFNTQKITPTDVFSHYHTPRLDVVENLVVSVVEHLAKLDPVALEQFYHKVAPALTQLDYIAIAELTDVTRYFTPALTGLLSYNPASLVGMYNNYVDNIMAGKDSELKDLIGYSDLTPADLSSNTDLSLKELTGAQFYDLLTSTATSLYGVDNLAAYDFRKISLTNAEYLHGAPILQNIINFAGSVLSSVNTFFTDNAEAITEFASTLMTGLQTLNHGEMNQLFSLNSSDSITNTSIFEASTTTDTTPLLSGALVGGELGFNMPVVSKVLQVLSREKINLLPLETSTKELINTFSVATTRPPTSGSGSPPQSPIMRIIGDTRELESPPTTMGGLGVTLKYPYLPETWSGVSHIGLLKEHTRTDVKTFTSNITVDWDAVVQDVVIEEHWSAMDYNFYHQLWQFYMLRKHCKYRPKDLNTFEYLVEIVEIKAAKQNRFWVNGVTLKLKVHAEGGTWNDPADPNYPADGVKDPYKINKIFPDHIDDINERK